MNTNALGSLIDLLSKIVADYRGLASACDRNGLLQTAADARESADHIEHVLRQYNENPSPDGEVIAVAYYADKVKETYDADGNKMYVFSGANARVTTPDSDHFGNVNKKVSYCPSVFRSLGSVGASEDRDDLIDRVSALLETQARYLSSSGHRKNEYLAAMCNAAAEVENVLSSEIQANAGGAAGLSPVDATPPAPVNAGDAASRGGISGSSPPALPGADERTRTEGIQSLSPAPVNAGDAPSGNGGETERGAKDCGRRPSPAPDTRTLFDPNRHCDAERVIAWIDNPERELAVLAFTEGLERQIAYRFETAAASSEVRCVQGQAPAGDGSHDAGQPCPQSPDTATLSPVQSDSASSRLGSGAVQSAAERLAFGASGSVVYRPAQEGEALIPESAPATQQPDECSKAYEAWFKNNPPLANRWSSDSFTGFEAGWDAAMATERESSQEAFNAGFGYGRSGQWFVETAWKHHQQRRKS